MAPTPRNERERLEQWTLDLCSEAFAVNATETENSIIVITKGFRVFCPQPFTTDQLHKIAAVFLRIARLQ